MSGEVSSLSSSAVSAAESRAMAVICSDRSWKLGFSERTATPSGSSASSLLKSTVQYAPDVRGSDYAIIFHQVGYVEEYYQVWKEYQTRTPVAGVYLDGVPLVTFYARPGKPLPTGLKNIEL